MKVWWGVGWGGIITNVVVVLKKGVKSCEQLARYARDMCGVGVESGLPALKAVAGFRIRRQDQCKPSKMTLTWTGFAGTVKSEKRTRELSWDVVLVFMKSKMIKTKPRKLKYTVKTNTFEGSNMSMRGNPPWTQHVAYVKAHMFVC